MLQHPPPGAAAEWCRSALTLNRARPEGGGQSEGRAALTDSHEHQYERRTGTARLAPCVQPMAAGGRSDPAAMAVWDLSGLCSLPRPLSLHRA